MLTVPRWMSGNRNDGRPRRSFGALSLPSESSSWDSAVGVRASVGGEWDSSGT